MVEILAVGVFEEVGIDFVGELIGNLIPRGVAWVARGEGVIAAMAVEGRVFQVRCWDT